MRSLAQANGYKPTPYTLGELAALRGSFNEGFKVVVDSRQDNCNMFQRVCNTFNRIVLSDRWLKRTARVFGTKWFDNSHDLLS
jgi:hypothetical protein